MVEGAEAEPPVGPTKAAGVCGTLGTYGGGGGENRRRGQGAGRRGGRGGGGGGAEDSGSTEKPPGHEGSQSPRTSRHLLADLQGKHVGGPKHHSQGAVAG